MNEERLKEIKNIFDTADIYGDDFEIARELYNEVVRLREIIDKANNEIKKYKYIDNWGDTVVLAKYLEDILNKSNLTLEQLNGIENE